MARTINIPESHPRLDRPDVPYTWRDWCNDALPLIPRNEGTMGALLSLSAKLDGVGGVVTLENDEHALLQLAAMDSRWNGPSIRAYGHMFDAVIRAKREG